MNDTTHTRHSIWQVVFLAIIIFIGFWYWQAMLAALVIAAWQRWFGATLILGLLLDLAYGDPYTLQWWVTLVPIPFTLLAVVFCALSYLGKKFISAGERQIEVGR